MGGAAKKTVSSAGSGAGTSVVVNRSIGPIAIGMTRPRVTALLGRPKSTLTISSSVGEPGTLARYVSHGAPLQVVFGSDGRVVSVQAYSSAYRTAAGAGPGSSVSRLHGFHQDYCELGYWNGNGATPQGGVVTVFSSNGGFIEGVLISQLRFYTACDTSGPGQEPKPNVSTDRSIGNVSLGMSEARVERTLGRPAAAKTVSLGGSNKGTAVRYTVLGAPFLITYDASKHATIVEGYSKFLFTSAAAGPSSPRSLVAGLSGFTRDPCGLGYWDGKTKPPSSDITVFTLRGTDVATVLIAPRRLYTGCAIRSYELRP
jgi:hypothetical protein